MNEPIWRASVRALITTFAKWIGILAALILLIYYVNNLEESELEISTDFSEEIQPNAEGVRKKQTSTAPVILEVHINGVIGTEGLEQKDLEKLLVESRENSLKNNRVKAILLRLNTPGGGAADADGMYRALLEYKKRYNVPVYGYIDGICASGGVYVSCAADELYASDVSLIGSVGVITSSFLNFSKTMDKIGVDALTIYAGKGKDELNPLRPWKEGESDNIKDVIDATYKNFVAVVSKNRPKLTSDVLTKETGAKIFIANDALQLGFIDGLASGRDEVLKKLLVKLSIEDDFYQVVSLSSTNWYNQLFKAESPLFTGKITHHFLNSDQIPKRLYNQPLYLYQP
ncbi:MAG: S49 family peptidase [Parachlamydiaceae bacterium]